MDANCMNWTVSNLFSFGIDRRSFFSSLIFFYFKKKKTHFPIWVFNSVFTIKIIAGFGLTYIYTHQYKDRSTADIFKYYDDAKVMYSSLEKAPKDYFRMITGIGNNTFHFDTCYYEKMNHWYKRNDFGLYNDNHTIIRFNAILMPFTFNSFHAHTVIMCFFSFIGLYFLFSFFNYFLKDKEWLGGIEHHFYYAFYVAATWHKSCCINT